MDPATKYGASIEYRFGADHLYGASCLRKIMFKENMFHFRQIQNGASLRIPVYHV